MGLRIKTNVASLTAQRQLGNNIGRLNNNLEKLSSGQRINKAADDAAGLALSENLKAQVKGLNQARRNANDGISMIQTAEGAYSEISNILIRLRELSVQSASDTIGDRERGYLNKEYTELVDEVDRIANVTEFNGLKVLKGNSRGKEMTDITLHIGTGSGLQSNSDSLKLDFSEIKVDSQTLGLGKENEIGPTFGQDNAPPRAEIAQKLDTIDDALIKISGQRAALGANQSRLQKAVGNLAITVENMSAANSRIRDVDFASETASLTQNKILAQAGTAVLTQANTSPEMALSLIR